MRRVATAVDDDDIQGKAYDTILMRRIWRFVVPHQRWLWGSLAIAPVAIAAELSQPVLLRHAINEIGEGNASGLTSIALIYLALVFGQSMATYAQLYAQQLAGSARRTIFAWRCTSTCSPGARRSSIARR
jgi:ABC-type multidrug transport system fused ATPase/permease subunit